MHTFCRGSVFEEQSPALLPPYLIHVCVCVHACVRACVKPRPSTSLSYPDAQHESRRHALKGSGMPSSIALRSVSLIFLANHPSARARVCMCACVLTQLSQPSSTRTGIGSCTRSRSSQLLAPRPPPILSSGSTQIFAKTKSTQRSGQL